MAKKLYILIEFIAVMAVTAIAIVVMINFEDWVNRSEAMRAMEQLGPGTTSVSRWPKLDLKNLVSLPLKLNGPVSRGRCGDSVFCRITTAMMRTQNDGARYNTTGWCRRQML